MKRLIFAVVAAIAALCSWAQTRPSQYIDPRIGSEGLGRTFIGPSLPFGMIKPSPDGVSMPNAGWAPMPETIQGFSQTHVSGTGGGQKYGNVLVMPFAGEHGGRLEFPAERIDESILPAYYSSNLQGGLGVAVTCTHGAAIYQFDYPAGDNANVAIDASWYLGKSPEIDGRETQQFVGSQVEIVGDNAVRGYNRVRGGWNNGRAYTVYFYAEFDHKFVTAETWKGDAISDQPWQSDTHEPTGALLGFGPVKQVTMKIGISFLSELKARDNLMAEIPGWDFESVREAALGSWDDLLSRIELAPSATEKQRRMFYTGLYHTMIMPSDRSGENPMWSDDSPYYDDFYAIWDTYRTSSPMITLIDPSRQTDIVNSLLNICKRDGYMPDARSGNSNGRTQGGSNAEIVIADAFAKGLPGIDYEAALRAMLKDAEVPPGGNEEAEGRGGLHEYLTLGYIPFGIDRAGNRTVEYAYCDYAIAQVAKGLGHNDIHDRYMRQSENWKNLWRDDCVHAGTRGFIMPRDADGQWLDSLPQGDSHLRQAKYKYTPMTFEGPWYTPWWGMFFYEAPSWEYSMSIPHDVEGLIERCGGPQAFEQRLDTLFDCGFYNVNNEPSFLSPCLYHWIGKPWRSSDRIRSIIEANYSDTPMGLPGNDDSGAMSSWLAFHMLGLYPNAGQDYYLVNTPMVESATLHLADGKDFTIETRGFAHGNRYITSATLNGQDYPYAVIHHADLAKGGRLVLTLGSKPTAWGSDPSAIRNVLPMYAHPEVAGDDSWPQAPAKYVSGTPLKFVFKPHGQTRRYTFTFDRQPDGSVVLSWAIERNLKMERGQFVMSPKAVKSATMLDFTMPENGKTVDLPDDMSAYMLSTDAYDALKAKGKFVYGNAQYKKVADNGTLIHVREDAEGTEMWILDDPNFPIVWQMRHNPLEVNWSVQEIKK